MAIRKNLPSKVMEAIYASTSVEGRLLDSLATSSRASSDLFNQYKAAKNVEREALKHAVAEAPDKAGAIVESYKTLIRDGAYDDYLYDHFKLREQHTKFFDTPSKARKKYNDLKRQEFETLDTFLQGASQGKVPARVEVETVEKAVQSHNVPARVAGPAAVKPAHSHKVPETVEGQTAVKPAHSHKVPETVEGQTAVKPAHSHNVPERIDNKTAVKPAHSHKVPERIDNKTAVKPAHSHKVPANIESKKAKKPVHRPTHIIIDVPAKYLRKHVKKATKSPTLESKSSQMQAQVFVIFLCIFLCRVIGSIDLQRVEIDEDDFTANESAREAASLDVKETTNQGNYNRSKDVQAPAAQSVVASPNETETYEKPSSEEKKSGQRVHVGTRAADLRSLSRYNQRYTSAESFDGGQEMFS